MQLSLLVCKIVLKLSVQEIDPVNYVKYELLAPPRILSFLC